MKTFRFVSCLLPLTLLCLATLPAGAADLPPSGTNTIRGFVRFVNADPDILARLGPPGDEGMTSFAVIANSAPPNALAASKSLYTDDRLSHPYELTVAANDVPLTYSAYASIGLDGILEEYLTATLTAVPLTSNSPPAELDFDECIALIELRYQRADASPVAALGGRASVKETASGALRARYFSQTPGRTGNFLVVPSGVEIELSVEVDTGADIYLDRITHQETHIMTLACDDKPVITITIPETGTLGSIVGNANLVGEIELPTDGYLELLGRPVIKATGPYGNQRYGALAAETPGADLTRAFTLENLVPSIAEQAWRVQAEMQFGDGYRFEYFITPALGLGLNPGVEVTAGATTDLEDTFVMTPARLVGKITLTGPPEFGGNLSALRGLVRSSDYDDNMDGIPDFVGASGINGSYVIATGVDELAPGATHTTAGGQATASFAGAFNPVTSAFEGDYEAVVGMLNDQPGIWRNDGLNLSFYHPGTNGGPFVNELLYIVDDAPSRWQGTLEADGRATNDMNYGFAEVCLRIKSPAPFYYPRVVNTYGYHTNYDGIGNVLNSYLAILGNASAPPYYASDATNEAVVTMYLPAGAYTLQPAISIVGSDGSVSEVQLPTFDISVVAGERLCVEDCIRLVIELPGCTPTFGFLARANAVSCDGTLTNLSLRASPLSDPSIRLGYSDIRILIGSRTELTTAHGLFPEFDGFDLSLYRDILYTATALDNQGRVATRQIVAHYDFTPPVLNCSDITVVSPNGVDAVVDYNITTSGDETLTCVPPSGSTFLIGATPVTCIARDFCRNTNTCAFNVTVRGLNEDCVLRIALTQLSPPEVTLSWDCTATLQSADTVDGPWTSIAGATSPYPTPADGPQKFFRLCLSGDCSGVIVGDCNPAGSIAYEPFDYAPATALNGLNGGTGFSDAWTPTIGGVNYTIADGSLAFDSLCTNGGRMQSVTGHTQMGRHLSATFGADGTTRYFSFLLRPEGVLHGGDLGGFHGLQLQGGAGALFIGKPGGAGGGVTAPYVLEEVGGGGQVLSTVAPVVGETVLLVVKAEFAAGDDTFTLYVNPTPGSPEPVGSVVKSDVDIGSTDYLLIYSGGEFSLDEIRLGETFESVTPRQ